MKVATVTIPPVTGLVFTTSYAATAVTITVDDALPIQLTSFTALSAGANSVKLEWATVSELNNYGFYIERRSDVESASRNFPTSLSRGTERHCLLNTTPMPTTR